MQEGVGKFLYAPWVDREANGTDWQTSKGVMPVRAKCPCRQGMQSTGTGGLGESPCKQIG